MVSEEQEELKDDDVEVTETEEEQEESEEQSEESEEESSSEESDESASNEDGEELIVTIGDEEPKDETASAPEWVKELRKAHRDTQRENKELKAKLEAIQKPETVQLGAKPKIEDFDYDAEKFEAALLSWSEKKREADRQQSEREAQQRSEQEAWQKQVQDYETTKATLKVKDFNDVEDVVSEALSSTQQGIIVSSADNPALLVYALGKNPEKLKSLAAIKQPLKFAVEIGKIEKDLKVKNRKTPPAPETRVKGNASKSGAVDSTLERLRDEAAKTGDFTKVMRYKAQKAKK